MESSKSPRTIAVCQYHSCLRNRSAQVLEAFQSAVSLDVASDVVVSSSECMGQCSSGPTVYVTPDRTWYCRVKPEDAIEIVTQHVQLDQPVERLLHPRFHPRCDC